MGSVARLEPDDPREIGPYRLLGQLGGGGMGRVFLGMSPGGRPIAVKVIRPELAADPEFLTRFRGEVEAARKVSGLFTALVVDADLDDPVPWLATAYVPGPSLTEAVDGHGPLPAATLLALAAGLAESLTAIHAAGVVHLDLKPSNVLLAEDGPRVIDFGISQAAAASAETGTNVVIGSPGYMSPEQVLDLDVGPASDMFSLGSVLAFAATGQPPFGYGSRAAVSYRLVNSQVNLRHVPIELRALIGNCLAKDPQDRPTARELLTQVGAIQPARGWIAEPILAGAAADGSGAEPEGPVAAGTFLPFASLVGAAPAGSGAARHAPRRRGRRVPHGVATAGVTGGLVAACGVVVFFLLGAGHDPSTGQGQAQAGATVSASGSVSPDTGSTAGPNAPAVHVAAGTGSYKGPSLSPSLSEYLSPTPSPSGSAGPSSSPAPGKSAGGSASPSAKASASASASASSSASASPSPTDSSSSPSPSPTDSSSASPTPTGSTSPSPTESASSSPSPSDSASASASDAAPTVSAS